MIGFNSLKSTPLNYSLLGLVCLSLAVMTGIVGVDREWTLWLHQHRWSYLTETMGRTMFKGGWPGSGDLSILFLAVVFFCYIFVCIKNNSYVPARWRPHLGYILITAFITCLGIVHPLKWFIGRARPALVVRDGLPYSHWFEFGPHFVTQGIYRGSFPSGHTALSLIFMALAYALAGDKRHDRLTRAAGIGVGVFAIVNSLLMSVARAMSLSHWLSDCLASMLFSWIAIHIIYFYMLSPRAGMGALNAQKADRRMPPFWELHFCLHIAIILLGLLAVGIGFRALIQHQGFYLIGLIPLGGLTILYSWSRARAVYRKGLNSHD